MVPALKDLGILDAFSPGVADFSRITGDRSLHIQTVVHQAFIAVDEHGTEAAAATGVGVGTTSVPVPFRADRPFLFFIVDHVTETLLFMGRVADPSAG
jgi:serpin B